MNKCSLTRLGAWPSRTAPARPLVRTAEPVDARSPTPSRRPTRSPVSSTPSRSARSVADEIIVGTARDTHEAVARPDLRRSSTGRSPVGRVTRGDPRRRRAAPSTAASAASLQGRRPPGCSKVGATRRRPAPRRQPPGPGAAVGGQRPHRRAAPGRAPAPRAHHDRPRRRPRRTPRPPPSSRPPSRDATDRVVVFLHGLGEHEGHWNTRAATRWAAPTAAGWPRAPGLDAGLPAGQHRAAPWPRTASRSPRCCRSWSRPGRCEVRRIALVGHSMGGLIIRAGCAVATDHARAVASTVLSDVVTLGTPHLGADLALGVSHGSRFLALLPEIAGFGRILEHRSPGHPRPRARPARAAAAAARALPPGLGGAGLASAARSAPLFGDLLVRRPRPPACAASLRLFPDADLLHVANAGHFALLNHPEVDHAMTRLAGMTSGMSAPGRPTPAGRSASCAPRSSVAATRRAGLAGAHRPAPHAAVEPRAGPDGAAQARRPAAGAVVPRRQPARAGGLADPQRGPRAASPVAGRWDTPTSAVRAGSTGWSPAATASSRLSLTRPVPGRLAAGGADLRPARSSAGPGRTATSSRTGCARRCSGSRPTSSGDPRAAVAVADAVRRAATPVVRCPRTRGIDAPQALELSPSRARVGDVTDIQMNGGGAGVRPRRPHLPAAPARSASSSSGPRCATRTPTRSARRCSC